MLGMQLGNKWFALTTEHDEDHHTMEKLEQDGWQLLAECQKAPTDPQIAEWLRVAKSEVSRMTELLKEKDQCIQLQQDLMEDLKIE